MHIEFCKRKKFVKLSELSNGDSFMLASDERQSPDIFVKCKSNEMIFNEELMNIDLTGGVMTFCLNRNYLSYWKCVNREVIKLDIVISVLNK